MEKKREGEKADRMPGNVYHAKQFGYFIRKWDADYFLSEGVTFRGSRRNENTAQTLQIVCNLWTERQSSFRWRACFFCFFCVNNRKVCFDISKDGGWRKTSQYRLLIAFFTFINVTLRNKNPAHIRVALLYFRPRRCFSWCHKVQWRLADTSCRWVTTPPGSVATCEAASLRTWLEVAGWRSNTAVSGKNEYTAVASS